MVSVIIPIFNVEDYLPSCIESVLSQTYRNIEIILVDDGSTDSSGGICDEFKKKDCRVRVIHKENGGLSSARNIAILLASGDYITFVDGDDVISPHYVDVLMSPVREKGVDFSCIDALNISQLPFSFEEPIDTIAPKYYSGKDSVLLMLHGQEISVSACGKLAKKSVWETTLFPEDRVYEDLATTIKAIGKAQTVAVVHAPLYGQMIRPGSITRKTAISAKQYSDYHAALEDCCEYVRKMYGDECEAALLSRRVLEFSRMIRLFKEVLPPEEDSRRIMLAARDYLKKNIGKALKEKNIPISTKVKGGLVLLSPNLYDILYRMHQKAKKSRK